MSREVMTEPEAVAAFAEADSGSYGPVLVDYLVTGGPSLTVGAGRSMSVACYQATLDPPYFASLGDYASDEMESWSCGGSYSEMPARQLIEKQVALEGVKEFMHTQERPTCIRWQEV